MAAPLAACGRASSPRRLAAHAIELLERVPLSIHLLLFRLAIASVFLPAGLNKLASWEPTLALFRDEYRVPLLAPALAAVMATTIEIGCSGLLMAGLATRVATLPLLGQLVTIQLFVYPQASARTPGMGLDPPLPAHARPGRHRARSSAGAIPDRAHAPDVVAPAEYPGYEP